LTIICLLLNFHILLFNGYHNGNTIKCYATRTNPYYIFPKWERVHLVVYNLCPFIIMLSCNMYIISITIRSARIRTCRKGSQSKLSRHRQLSLMLMLVTFAFVFLTLPSCLYYVFFRHRMSSKNSSRTYRYMVQICLSSVQFTSHAVNFFLYCFSARNFRHELRGFMEEIWFCRSIKSKSNHSSLTTLGKDQQTRKNLIQKEEIGHESVLKDIPTRSINEQSKQNRIYDNETGSS
jgi:hypothetical protein